MYKNGVLTISDWTRGIAESPYEGFADMANVDIHSKPGAVLIAPAPTKISDSTVTGLVNWIGGTHTTDNIYAVDDEDRVYEIDIFPSASVSLVVDKGDPLIGGAIWKDYLFVFDRGSSSTTNVHVYGPLSGSASWTNNWESFQLARLQLFDQVPALVGTDNTLYFGDGNVLASVIEATGNTFDPTDNTTYTLSTEALDLPDGYDISSISQISSTFYIGAAQENQRNSAIFPWDGTSPSFNLPLIINNEKVSQQIAKGNILFFTVEDRSVKIVATNGTVVEDAAKIRNLVFTGEDPKAIRHTNAVAIHDDGILFGISNNADASPQGTSPTGVYYYKNDALTRFTISTGNSGGSGIANRQEIGAIAPTSSGTFLVGWQEGVTTTEQGIDEFGQNGYRYTGYKALIDSPLSTVGTRLKRKTFQNLEFRLGRPLEADQGIKISYRKNLADAFTEIGTFDFATLGAVSSHATNALITDAESVQLRIEMTTATDSTTTPELLEVLVY